MNSTYFFVEDLQNYENGLKPTLVI